MSLVGNVALLLLVLLSPFPFPFHVKVRGEVCTAVLNTLNLLEQRRSLRDLWKISGKSVTGL